MADNLTLWRNGGPFVAAGFGNTTSLTAWRNGGPFVRFVPTVYTQALSETVGAADTVAKRLARVLLESVGVNDGTVATVLQSYLARTTLDLLLARDVIDAKLARDTLDALLARDTLNIHDN